MNSSSLGDLSDPAAYWGPIVIEGCDRETLIRQLRTMLLIRRAEEVIGDGVASRKVIGPAHLGIGQEAVAVGVAQHLRPTDQAYGAHRSHSHYLAAKGELYALLAEILGRVDGCSGGMGGSMHLWAGDRGLAGTVPIVAGTVALAVGAALAAKKDGRNAVAVAYFGDGAAEEGVIHESLNLASIWKLPVFFVCENNMFASHMHISLRQPANGISRYAKAHRIDFEMVDGNDVVAVSRSAAKLISASREGAGPGFLEAVTYRWRGHVGHREDEDVGVNRGPDLMKWKGRDPVRRLADALIAADWMTRTEFANMDLEVKAEVATAWARAEVAAFPPASALLDCVYADRD